MNGLSCEALAGNAKELPCRNAYKVAGGVEVSKFFTAEN
jgi:hypothetical protein